MIFWRTIIFLPLEVVCGRFFVLTIFPAQQYFELRTRALKQANQDDGLVTYPHKFEVTYPDVRDYIAKYGHLQNTEAIETEIVSVAGTTSSTSISRSANAKFEMFALLFKVASSRSGTLQPSWCFLI